MLGGHLALLLPRPQAHLNLRGSSEHSKKRPLSDAFRIPCLWHCPSPALLSLSEDSNSAVTHLPQGYLNGLKSRRGDCIGL